MYKCICGAEFETVGALGGHKAKCPKYQSILFRVLDSLRESGVLERWFKMKGTSFRLCELLNKRYPDVKFNAQKVITYCREHAIQTPNVKEGNNSPHVRKFRHEHNTLAKGTPGYKKRNKTIIEKYGVSNVFQLDSVKEKSKQSMLEKYGVPNPVYLPWFKSNTGTLSKPHKKVSDYLISLGFQESIDFINEPREMIFAGYNEELGKNFCPRPDILFPGHKLVIEVYGDRWHGNPKLYTDDCVISTWYGNITPREIRQRDRIRISHIKSFGYDVIELWESDIKQGTFIDILKQYELFKDKIN